MSHQTNQCKHGVVISQCRCPGPDKVVHIVPCPPECRVITVNLPEEAPQSLIEPLSVPTPTDDLEKRLQVVTEALGDAMVELARIANELRTRRLT